MHSERLGKPAGVQKKSGAEGGRRPLEVETEEGNIMYFSIKPMLDKARGKENIEKNLNRDRKTTYTTARETHAVSAKYSARDRDENARSAIEKRVLITQPRSQNQPDHQLGSGRSYRLLNQFFPPQEEQQPPISAPKTMASQQILNKFARQNIQRVPFPNFQGLPVSHQKKNSSMISSKSYEILDAMNHPEDDKSSACRPDELHKNKTMLNFNKILEQSKSTRGAMANFFADEPLPSKPYVPQQVRMPASQAPTQSPNDSYIFRNGQERSGLQYIANSPAHSAVRNKTYDKSKMSALNRSDISKTSNGNNSFLTRRGDDGELSRVAAQQNESNNRGGMSKTWVKSALMDSREEISTFKNPKGRLLDRSGMGDRSALDMSDEKSAKKKNLHQEIEDMFARELTMNSKESTTSSSRAKEYELQKCIGQGAYAKVYKALHLPTNTKVAIKLYEKAKLTEKLRQKSIKREIKILSRLNHPNIVNFIDCFSTKNHIYLVMELVRGLSLYELLKKQPDRRIKENNARTLIKQILKATVYCHSKCVSHRDIKLENIIISGTGVIKVIDFGFSTCIPNDKRVKMFCGTPSYMAPEIAQKTEYCGPPVDIWAIGVLFFVLVSGKFPFKGSTDTKLYHRISHSDPVFDDWVSEDVRAVILQMIGKEADSRPTAVDLLNSAYFKKKREPSPSKPSFEASKAHLSVRNTSNPNFSANTSAIIREEKSQVAASRVELGKTTRLFTEMLTTLGGENMAMTPTTQLLTNTNLKQFGQHQLTQSPSPLMTSQPLRDDTKRQINGYFNKSSNVTQGLGLHTPQLERDKLGKELWPSRLRKEEPKSIRVEPKKTMVLDDREKSATKKSSTNIAGMARDAIKDRYKKFEDAKPAAMGFKRTVTDDRIKYDRGDISRVLGYK